jgi:hypothetical protein
MKILIDMNLSPLWVRFLADAGFDSVHWSSIGPSAAPDTQIMDYASANGLVCAPRRASRHVDALRRNSFSPPAPPPRSRCPAAPRTVASLSCAKHRADSGDFAPFPNIDTAA